MRRFTHLVLAVGLSALAVALLTCAGWPRPRFVLPLPAMEKSTSVRSGPQLRLDCSDVTPGGPPPPSRAPWVGFRIRHAVGSEVTRNDFWWVNARDGRASGPWPLDGNAHAWDHRGAAVAGGGSPAAFPQAGAIGRLDPETGHYAPICDDRHADFLVSANGETLLTFTAPKPTNAVDWQLPRGDADMVCYDLTTDPPARTRIDLTVREGRAVFLPDLHEELNRVGSLALSPDGRTLAVAEVWRRHLLVSPRGVRLFDTRTGLATRTLTDYGPELRNPAHWDDGAHGLVFSPDSRFLRLHWLPRRRESRPVYSPREQTELDRSGPQQLIDTATGAYVPPPHPGYTPDRALLPGPLSVRTDDGSRRLETDGDPSGGAAPFRFRVVDADGTPRCDWRTLSPAERGGLPISPGGQFVPGTTGLVWANTTPAPPTDWWQDRARRLLRLPPAGSGVEVVWYDWAADELRVVSRFVDTRPGADPVRAFVQEGRVAVLFHDFAEGKGYVEVWDAPPPRRPWPWSVPAGVALGLLLTAAGVRLWLWLARRASEGRAATPP